MNFWQKVELGIIFIFFIEGAQPLPLYGVLPWGVSDGVGEGWGISAGKGEGSRKGKWGVCRKREGRETGGGCRSFIKVNQGKINICTVKHVFLCHGRNLNILILIT